MDDPVQANGATQAEREREVDVKSCGVVHYRVNAMLACCTAFNYLQPVRPRISFVGIEDGVASYASDERTYQTPRFGLDGEAAFIKDDGFLQLFPDDLAQWMNLIGIDWLDERVGRPVGAGR